MTKWPVLETIIPRILAVYSLFSSDLHSSGTSSHMSIAQEPIFDDLRHGRLMSMRYGLIKLFSILILVYKTCFCFFVACLVFN